MKTGFNIGRNLLRYKSNVQSLLATSESFFPDPISVKKTEYYKELDELAKELEDSEKDFLRELGLNNFSDLANRIEVIDQDLGFLIDNKQDIIDKLRPYFNVLHTKDLLPIFMDALNKYFSVFDNAKGLFQINDKTDDLERNIIAQESLNELMSTFNIKDKRFSGAKSNIGITARILVSTEKNENELSFKVESKMKKSGASLSLTSDQKRRIVEIIKGIEESVRKKLPREKIDFTERIQKARSGQTGSSNTSKDNYSNFLNELKFLIKSNLQSTRLKKMVDTEFNEVNKKYAIYPNSPSISGFLGELRMNLILKLLFPNSNKVIPTGFKKFAESGQELNIDAIFKSFGFQVKNYKINQKGEVTFSSRDSEGMQNFIENKLGVEGTPRYIIESMFAAYQYNQPFRDLGDKKQVEKYKKDIYNPLVEILKDKAKKMLSQRAVNYIGLVKKGAAEDQEINEMLFGQKFNTNPTYLKNTFFMVGKKLVPSSYIVRAMISALEKSNLSNESNISNVMFEYSETNNEITLENDRKNEIERIAKSSKEGGDSTPGGTTDFYRVLNLIKVTKSSVKLNIDNLFDQAVKNLTLQ